jgi:hypothetical protein
MPGKLLVNLAAGERLLVNSLGHPVWPVHSQTDQERLRRLAACYGATLEEAEGCRSAGPEMPTVEETVATTESSYWSLTQLYAHLTGRSALFCADGEVSTLADHTRVLITRPAWLSPDRALACHAKSQAHDFGIIMADDCAELLTQVLLRSAALALSDADKQPDVFFAPTLPGGKVVTRKATLLGGKTSRQEIADALTAGAGTLAINTHGDGVDAFLGPLTLCPMDGSHRELGLNRAPTCLITGQCYRHGLPVTEVHRELAISPDALSARVLILGLCWGINLEPALISQRFGYLRRFLLSGGVGAILAPWSLVMSGPPELARVFDAVSKGMTIGAAARAAAKWRPPERGGVRFLLFGDPRARAHGRETEVVAAGATSDARRRAPARTDHVGDSADLDDARFLMAHLEELEPTRAVQAPSSEPPSEPDQRHAEAMSALRRYVQTSYLGKSVEEGAPLGAELRKCVLRFLAAGGTLPSSIWLAFAKELSVRPAPDRCFVCASPVDHHHVELRTGMTRVLANCPQCGMIFDQKQDRASPRIELVGNRVLLTLPSGRPSSYWSGRLAVEPDEKPFARQYDWPAQDSGAPAEALELGAGMELRDGFSYLALFWMERASLSITRIPVYRQRDSKVIDARSSQLAFRSVDGV